MIDIGKLKKSKTTKELLKFGIINIDKPSGPTSFNVSQYVKKSLKLPKTSHLGTLDPAVSGVLPVALSRACRLNEYLMHKNKTYVGIMRLHANVDYDLLKKTVDKFIGKITQMPPVRSSVKRQLRQREVKYFKILEIKDRDVLFETEVEAGTYIRTLCVDIGKDIGGAHMLELRRIKAGIFSEDTSINLYDFDKLLEEYKNGDDANLRKAIVPGEVICNFLPYISIRKDALKKAFTGSPIFRSFLSDEKEIRDLSEGDKICILCNNGFVGCYNFIGKGDMIAKPEFVLN